MKMVTPMSQNSPRRPKKSPPAKKPKTDVQSRRSVNKSKRASPKKPIDITKGIETLKKIYPEAHCELNYRNPFELLVATVLSAQCTDVRVNLVTPALFHEAPGPEQLSKMPIERIEDIIRSTGFFKNKAKNLKALAQTLVEKYHGEVPQDLDALVELPGVGRKTANVVLGNAFHIASGVVVDTHVSRLSQRLGWTRNTTPEKIEMDLEKSIPKSDWILISHLLISHGRSLCKARNPDCVACFFVKDCPSAKSLQKF